MVIWSDCQDTEKVCLPSVLHVDDSLTSGSYRYAGLTDRPSTPISKTGDRKVVMAIPELC